MAWGVGRGRGRPITWPGRSREPASAESSGTWKGQLCPPLNVLLQPREPWVHEEGRGSPRGEARLQPRECVQLPSDLRTVTQAGKPTEVSTTHRIQSRLLRLALRALLTLATTASPHQSLGAGPMGPSIPRFLGWPSIWAQAVLSSWNALLHILFWGVLPSRPGSGITSSGTPSLGAVGLAAPLSVLCQG